MKAQMHLTDEQFDLDAIFQQVRAVKEGDKAKEKLVRESFAKRFNVIFQKGFELGQRIGDRADRF